MSFWDAVPTPQGDPGAIPSAPVQPAAPTTGLNNLNSAPVAQTPVQTANPAPAPQPAAPKSFWDSVPTPSPSSSTPQTTQPQTPTSSGSFWDSMKTPTQPTAAPAPVQSPYFATTTPGGASIGFSDQKDVSGKPYFAYRNPGDTSTTTDTTRVATSFDPRVPQKIDPKLIQNQRMPESMSAPIRKQFGAGYNDELDHAIALELSGSNNKSNLKVMTGIKGGAAAAGDQYENQLAHAVATGQMSLWDAQTAMAKAKGQPTPWIDNEHKSLWDNIGGVIKAAAGDVKKGVAGVASLLNGFTQELTGSTANAETTPPTSETSGNQNPPPSSQGINLKLNQNNDVSSTTPKTTTVNSFLNTIVPQEPKPETISTENPSNVKVPEKTSNIITSQGTYVTNEEAQQNPEKIDPLVYLARGIGFGHDPQNDVTNWAAGYAKNPTLSDLPEPTTPAQKIAQTIGNTLTIALAAPAIDSVIASAVSKLPGGAELLSSIGKATESSPWKIGYPTAIAKAFGNGSIFGLITQNKQSIVNNVLQSGSTFAGFEALAYPVLSFFKPALESVGKTSFEKLGLPDNVDTSAITGNKPITDTLWFRNPNDSTQLLKVTGTGIESTQESALTATERETFSPNTITKLDIEAFQQKPSLYEKLLSWISGKYDEFKAIPNKQGGFVKNPFEDDAPEPKEEKTSPLDEHLSELKAKADFEAEHGKINIYPNEREFVSQKTAAKGETIPNTIPKQQSAINSLSEQKSGELPGALNHPDLGKIDLIWGKPSANGQKGFGLAKIISDHPDVIPNLADRISKAEVVEKLPQRTILQTKEATPLRVVIDHQLGKTPKTFLNNAYNVLREGVEPTTSRASNERSTIELPKQNNQSKDSIPNSGSVVKIKNETTAESITPSKYKAFGSGPKAPIEEIRSLLKHHLPDVKRGLVFKKDLLKTTGNLGEFSHYQDLITDEIKPLIKLYESGGKAPIRVAFHEAYHYLESTMSSSMLQKLNEDTLAAMTDKDKRYYSDRGYKTGNEQASEFRADEYGKQKADEAGYKSRIQKVLEAIDKFIKKIIDTAKAVFDRIQATPNKQGGFAKNPFEDDAPEPKEEKTSPLDEHLSELKTQLETMQESVNQDPAKSLAQYSNKKTGELPQALGTGASKFGKVGDQLASELGFKDSEEARLAYKNYQLKQQRVEAVKREITKLKETIKQFKAEDKDMKSLKSLMDKSAGLTEKDIAKIASNNKPPKIQKNIEIRKADATERMNRSMQSLKGVQPEAELQTLQTQGGLLQNSQPVSLEDFDKMNEDFSLPKIVIDASTPVKYKVGLLDYLRTPDRVLHKIGLDNVFKAIRTGYENYLAELPVHLNLIKEWADRAGGDGANKRIFNYLDGQYNQDYHAGKVLDPLSENELQIAGEIKEYLKEWADRLGLPDDNKITHYITHIFGISETEKEFDEDIANLIKNKVPGSVYDPFLEKRLGAKGYIQDTWKSLEAYVKRGTRKANMDPALEKLKNASKGMEESQFNYLKRFGDRINMRPTEIDNLLDNTIKQMIGYKFGQRPTAYLTGAARRIVSRSMIGLNVQSAIKHLSQTTNTFATLGPKYTAIGFSKLYTLVGDGGKELEDQGVLKQDVIQDRAYSAVHKAFEKMDKGLYVMFDIADKVNRGAAYFGAKQKGIDEGMSEEKAIEYAKKIVRDTHFQFGSIDTPVGINSDITKTFTQFLNVGIKQTEYLAEMIGRKEWWSLIRYAAATTALIYFLGKTLNLKASDYLPGSAVLKFGAPPVLSFPKSIWDALTNTPDQFGKIPSTTQKLTNIAQQIPFPLSSQAQKTYRGITAYNNPSKGIVHSPGTAVKAALLGTANLPTTKNAFQTTFDKIQQLKSSGDTAGAQAMLDNLSPADAATYDKMRKTAMTATTKANEKKMSPTLKQIQDLIAAGKSADAQKIVDNMTDDEYKAYKLDKKQAGITN